MTHEREVTYISGAITHDPHYKEKFADAEMVLDHLGYRVINPCILLDGLHYDEYMRIDLLLVEIADTVCMLPGWKKSNGAKREKARADEEKKRIISYKGIDTALPRW